MTFMNALLARGPATRLSRYTVWNGVLYLGLGAQLYVWPGAAQVLFMAPPFQAGEAGLVRLTGVTLAVVGWFYVMGGRTGAESFGLSTLVDRFALPFLLLPLVFFAGVDPHLAVPFAVLDPLLALGALLIWRKERAAGTPATGAAAATALRTP